MDMLSLTSETKPEKVRLLLDERLQQISNPWPNELVIRRRHLKDLNEAFEGTKLAYITDETIDASLLGATRTEKKNDCVEVEFSDALTCLQAIMSTNCKHLGPSEDLKFVQFISQSDSTPCELNVFYSLGKGGKQLDSGFLMEMYGYIPFEDLCPWFIDLDSMRSKTTQCPSCSEGMLVPIGISANVDWLAARCTKCTPESKGDPSKTTSQQFFRLCKSTRGNNTYRVILPVLKANYANFNEYCDVIGPIVAEEIQLILAQNDAALTDGLMSGYSLDKTESSSLIDVKIEVPISSKWNRNTLLSVNHLCLTLQQFDSRKNVKNVTVTSQLFYIEDSQNDEKMLIHVLVNLPNHALPPLPLKERFEVVVSFGANTPQLIRCLQIIQDIRDNNAPLTPIHAALLEFPCDPRGDLLGDSLDIGNRLRIANVSGIHKHEFLEFDEIFLGTFQKDVTVVCGASGSGKTFAMAMSALSLARCQYPEKIICISPSFKSQLSLVDAFGKIVPDSSQNGGQILVIVDDVTEQSFRKTRTLGTFAQVHFLHELVDEMIADSVDVNLKLFHEGYISGHLNSNVDMDWATYHSTRKQLEQDIMALVKYNIVVCEMKSALKLRLGTALWCARLPVGSILIDDAGSITQFETICLVGVGEERVVLFGDFRQKKCKASSERAVVAGFDISPIEWIANRSSSNVCIHKLHTQFQFKGALRAFLNEAVFPDFQWNLRSSEGNEIPSPWREAFQSSSTLIVVDCKAESLMNRYFTCNEFEAEVAMAICKRIKKYGLSLSEVVVTSVFPAQVEKLSNVLSGLDVNVLPSDSLEGKEFNYVITSINRFGDCGIRDFPLKLIKALTAARKGQIILVSKEMFAAFPLMNLLLKHGDMIDGNKF